MNLKISVIVTSYNLEKYISDCIKSIVEQSLKPDEIILVDDASTDNTIELALKIYPNLKVIKQPCNKGAFLNTLSGLNIASNDIIAFMDGDDIWSKFKLEKVMNEFLKDSSVFMVTHNHRRVDHKGNPTHIKDETHRNMDLIFSNKDSLLQQNLLKKSGMERRGFWFGSAYSFRRDVLDLDDFNLHIDINDLTKNAYLDLVLGPYLIRKNLNRKIVYLSDVYFDYRIHSAGSAVGKTVEKQLSVLKKLRATNELTRKILLANGYDNEIFNRYENIITEYDYMGKLYSKEYISAISYFYKLIVFFKHEKKIKKEFFRLIIVLIFGPKIFLKFK